MIKQYHKFLLADDKPEKGERKIADEQVLLISDIIDFYLKDKGINEEESKSFNLLKTCLCEYNYEKSCYNFDV